MDQATLDAAKSGSSAAIERAMLEARRIMESSNNFTWQGIDRDDVIQDAIVKVWRLLGNVRTAESFSGYVYRVFRNTVLNAKRDRRSPVRMPKGYEIVSISDEHPEWSQMLTPERVAIGRELHAAVTAAASSMGDYTAQVVSLTSSGMPAAAVAKQLGRTEQGVSGALKRFRIKHRGILS